MSEAVLPIKVRRWRDGIMADSGRDLAEEVAVALVYDGSTEAVMMATPADIEDFAMGFSLTEGLITGLDDVARFEIVPQAQGIEARLWLTPELGRVMGDRRRSRVGPAGCGLCGLESLSEALRPVAEVTGDLTLTPPQVLAAVASLEGQQVFGARTRALHAAALWRPGEGLLALREDVGRHNALDKLAGAARRQGLDGADLAVVLTSRVSVDLAQKVAAMGVPVLIAVSAPTAMALRVADAAGITVVAVARADGFEVFTHPQRIRRSEP